MVLVTSSIAEDACTLTLAALSEASATWLDPLATWVALSRTLLTMERRLSVMHENASISVSFLERGVIEAVKSPPATATVMAAISFRE